MSTLAVRIGTSVDRRQVDVGHEPERRGVRIRCDRPGCLETVHLIDGVGDVGSKVFRCPEHGWFGPGMDVR